ncbi:MAG: cysteine--tRNA ligase [Endomicrobium sp.]|jgi:cysteinyl-tRNA synthetase|nr:cysteine--tRNA ligase [Endomicrobium sp.]
MTIKIYNTLTNKKEEFQSQKEKFVSMYVCGVTPYDNMHLGHARAYVVFDIIKRHLLKRGYEVKHIQNFTDVDDKIIKRSQEKNILPSELVRTYIKDYFDQTEKLNILKAEKYPCVTQMIEKIIGFIQELVNKGFAYEVNGDVYFSVEKFKDYGKLSKRSLEDFKISARVDVSNDKRSVFDFVLWKKMKEGEPQEVIWESPWGKGRPGWHIECSVMSYELLGETIDIHGGGQDLIFPHHENEIAQSEAKSGKQFVRYWIHNGFVVINKEKMSKSLNNSFNLKTIFEKYDSRIVRYYLLTQNYSSPLDFSKEGLENTKNTLHGIDEFYSKLVDFAKESAEEITDKDLLILQENFLSSLDDNFNCPKALSYLHELKGLALKELPNASLERLSQFRSLFEDFAETSLGIALLEGQDVNLDLQSLLKKRNEARKNKNWSESDRLRKLICEGGYKIVDNKDGSSVLVVKKA